MNYKNRDQLVLRKIIPISILFQSGMIFYSLMPSIAIAVVSFLCFCIICGA